MAQGLRGFPVDVDGVEYRVHRHRPGRPRIYRVLKSGSLRKVPEDDPVIQRIPALMREKVDAVKAEQKRRQGTLFKVSRSLGQRFARLWAAIKEVARYRVF